MPFMLHIETVDKPERYLKSQLEQAQRIAFMVHRGKLVLTEPPRGAE